MTMVTVGIDEVGRGSWAGPLVASAVRLNAAITGLNDSKLLTQAVRERVSTEIYANADVGLGWVNAEEIDAFGLTYATAKAMRIAIEQLPRQYDAVVIDGNINYLPELSKAYAMIKADSQVPAVCAASIVAKVARDKYMRAVATKFPMYRFDLHVGYGTKLHIEAIRRHGICELHRRSFKPVRAYL